MSSRGWGIHIDGQSCVTYLKDNCVSGFSMDSHQHFLDVFVWFYIYVVLSFLVLKDLNKVRKICENINIMKRTKYMTAMYLCGDCKTAIQLLGIFYVYGWVMTPYR